MKIHLFFLKMIRTRVTYRQGSILIIKPLGAGKYVNGTIKNRLVLRFVYETRDTLTQKFIYKQTKPQ